MEENRYVEAIDIFEKLNGFWDSAEMIEKCNNAISSSSSVEKDIKLDSSDNIESSSTIVKFYKYKIALELMNSGKYNEAMEEFEKLDGYKSSKEMIEKCKKEIKSNDKDKKNSIEIDYSATDSSSDLISLYLDRINKKGEMFNFEDTVWDLYRGSSGDNVVKLQTALINLGYLDGTADGKYGKKTETAVKDFCKNNDIIGENVQHNTATRFIQALLYGGKALSKNHVNGIRFDNKLGHFSSDISLTINNKKKTFIKADIKNKASTPIEAVRFIDWFEDSNGNIIDNEYYDKYYYNVSINNSGRKTFDWSINKKIKDNKEIYRAVVFVAEIGYKSGDVYISYNNNNGSIEPLINTSKIAINS